MKSYSYQIFENELTIKLSPKLKKEFSILGFLMLSLFIGISIPVIFHTNTFFSFLQILISLCLAFVINYFLQRTLVYKCVIERKDDTILINRKMRIYRNDIIKLLYLENISSEGISDYTTISLETYSGKIILVEGIHNRDRDTLKIIIEEFLKINLLTD